MPKQKPLEKESLIIRFEHLNPRLQEIIGKPGMPSLASLFFLLMNLSRINAKAEQWSKWAHSYAVWQC